MAEVKGRTKRNQESPAASEVILSDDSPWLTQEAYKALRTNITFSLPGDGCKVLGVTSAFAHDGKSINAINTAIAFGQLGKRVLLLDCDLRKPTDALKLGIPGSPGMADVLAGQETFQNALRKDHARGIHVLPAGNLPPDPTWLLGSEQMKKIITLMKNYYDYIIIDLPPVTMVADSSIMAQYIDGFLLVVRHYMTDYRAVADMLAQLKFAKAKIIGFLYNDVEPGNTGYHRGYYKGYKSYYGR